MREPKSKTVKRVHPYAWMWEPLESEPSFLLRPMFGTTAAYIEGKIVLCFSNRPEPWRGVLVATDREHHASLMSELPALIPHTILPKWLHLPDATSHFERTAERLVQLVRRRDPRIGVVPKAKKRTRKKKKN